MNRFRILELIGEGTYGKVFKAQEKETGAVVAIKRFKQNEDEDTHVRKTMLREIKVLTDYPNENIVALREHFRENEKLYLIFDYIDRNLLEELQSFASDKRKPNSSCRSKVIKSGAPSSNKKSEQPKSENAPDNEGGGLPPARIKLIVYQILKATAFLHTSKILHRDIKPENLLLSKNGVIKLCDFGFARGIKEDKRFQYTDYVSTRWYRAPELLVGDAAYTCSIDIWAVGCIFAEIFNGLPLFPGDSDLHTLQLIMETITADDVKQKKTLQELTKKQRVAFKMNSMFEGVKVPLATNSLAAPEHAEEVCLSALLKGINDSELDFLRKCLVIDGTQRSTADELLEHQYFDQEFRDQFLIDFANMDQQDKLFDQMVAQNELRTKDDRSEIPLAELLIHSSDEEDEDVQEYDDQDDSEDSDMFVAQQVNQGVGLPEQKIVKKSHPKVEDSKPKNNEQEDGFSKNSKKEDDAELIQQQQFLGNKTGINTVHQDTNTESLRNSHRCEDESLELPKVNGNSINSTAQVIISDGENTAKALSMLEEDKTTRTKTESENNYEQLHNNKKQNFTQETDNYITKTEQIINSDLLEKQIDQIEETDQTQANQQSEEDLPEANQQSEQDVEEIIQCESPTKLSRYQEEQQRYDQQNAQQLQSEQSVIMKASGINRLSDVTLIKNGIHEEINESGSSQKSNSARHYDDNTSPISQNPKLVSISTPPRSRTQMDSLGQQRKVAATQEKPVQQQQLQQNIGSPNFPSNQKKLIPLSQTSKNTIQPTISSPSNLIKHDNSQSLLMDGKSELMNPNTVIISPLQSPAPTIQQSFNIVKQNNNNSPDTNSPLFNQPQNSIGPQKIAKVNITFAKRQSQIVMDPKNNLNNQINQDNQLSLPQSTAQSQIHSQVASQSQNQRSGQTHSETKQSNSHYQQIKQQNQQQNQLEDSMGTSSQIQLQHFYQHKSQNHSDNRHQPPQPQINFMQRRLKAFKMVHQTTTQRDSSQQNQINQLGQNNNGSNQVASGMPYVLAKKNSTHGVTQVGIQQNNQNTASKNKMSYQVQGVQFQTPVVAPSSKMAGLEPRQPIHQINNLVNNALPNGDNTSFGISIQHKQVLSSDKFKDLPNLQRTSHSNVPPKKQPNQYPKFTTNSMQSLNKLVDQAYGTKKLSPYYQMQPVKIGALPKLLESPNPLPHHPHEKTAGILKTNSSKNSFQSKQSVSERKINQNTTNLTNLTNNEDLDQENVHGLTNISSIQNNKTGLTVAYQPNSNGKSSFRDLNSIGQLPLKTFNSNPQQQSQNNTSSNSKANQQTSEYANAQHFPKRKMTFKLKNQGPGIQQNRRLANTNNSNQQVTQVVQSNANNQEGDHLGSNNQNGIIIFPQVHHQQSNSQAPSNTIVPSNNNVIQNNDQLAPQLTPIKIQHKSFTMLKQKNQNKSIASHTYNQNLQNSKDPQFATDTAALNNFISMASNNNNSNNKNKIKQTNESSKVAYGAMVNGNETAEMSLTMYQGTNSNHQNANIQEHPANKIMANTQNNQNNNPILMSQQSNRIKFQQEKTSNILNIPVAQLNQTTKTGGHILINNAAKNARTVLSHQGRSETSWANSTSNNNNVQQLQNVITVQSTVKKQNTESTIQSQNENLANIKSLSPIKLNLAAAAQACLPPNNRRVQNGFLPARQSQVLTYVRKQRSPVSPKNKLTVSKKEQSNLNVMPPQYTAPGSHNQFMSSQFSSNGGVTTVANQQQNNLRMQRL